MAIGAATVGLATLRLIHRVAFPLQQLTRRGSGWPFCACGSGELVGLRFISANGHTSIPKLAVNFKSSGNFLFNQAQQAAAPTEICASDETDCLRNDTSRFRSVTSGSNKGTICLSAGVARASPSERDDGVRAVKTAGAGRDSVRGNDAHRSTPNQCGIGDGRRATASW